MNGLQPPAAVLVTRAVTHAMTQATCGARQVWPGIDGATPPAVGLLHPPSGRIPCAHVTSRPDFHKYHYTDGAVLWQPQMATEMTIVINGLFACTLFIAC
jgi:hypothetical protein